MPDVVFAILGALVRLGRADRAWSIAEVSGYSSNYFARVKPDLLMLGWIERPFSMNYRITERGKIALAIETGRRTRRRRLAIKNGSFKAFSASCRSAWVVAYCPCCGQSVDRDRLLVDLNTNRAIYLGREVRIRPPQVAELVHTLATQWPKTVSHFDISYAVWGLNEPEGMRGSIAVHVSLARKSLSRLGFTIEAVEGRGYRLVMPEQPPVKCTDPNGNPETRVAECLHQPTK